MKYLKVNEASGSTEGVVELVLSDIYLATKPSHLDPETHDIVDFLSRPSYTIVSKGIPVEFKNSILYNFTLEFWIKCKFDPTNTEDKPIFDYLVYPTEIDEDGVVSTSSTLSSIIRIYSSPENNHNYVFNIHGAKKIINRTALDNQWNHIAIVHAGGTSIIGYVNGNPIVGKNTDTLNLTYLFDKIRFNIYDGANKVYIANINISDAPRYNKYFNPFKSLSPNTYGLGITEESIDAIRTLETSHESTAEFNQIYLPFQSFDMQDLGILHVTWTPVFTLEDANLPSDEDATNYLVDSSELSYYDINDIEYNLKYGRKFSITTRHTGLYYLKSVETIELTQYDEFTMDCFFKINYNQDAIIGDISIMRDQSTTTTQGLNFYTSITEAGQTFIGSSLFAFKINAIAKFQYNKLYHYAVTYRDGVMKHYLDGKLIFAENKVISDKKQNLMIGTVGAYQEGYYPPIHTATMWLSHFRLSSKILWEADFEPAQELFAEDETLLPDMIKNSENTETATDEEIALIYPILSATTLYDRIYNNTKGYKFKPEYDSTTKIKVNTTLMDHETAPAKWKTYPVITTDTYSDKFNYIKLIANKPILGDYTVEFWVYVEMKEQDSTYRDLAYFSGRDSFFGLKINGFGLLSLVYSKLNRYSTNFNTRQNLDLHEQIFTTAFTNRWVHLAFVHDTIATNGVTGLYKLAFYANGRLLETFDDWVDNSLLRLLITTGDSDSNIVPYYTGLKVTCTSKYKDETFDVTEV